MREIDIIEGIALISTFALGMWYTFGKDEVFAFWGQWIEVLPAWMSKPIGTCPRCMCGAFGIIALSWWMFAPQPLQYLVLLPCAIGAQEMLHR